MDDNSDLGFCRGVGQLQSGRARERLRIGDESGAEPDGEAGTAGGGLPFGAIGCPVGYLSAAGRQRFPEEIRHAGNLRHRSSSRQSTHPIDPRLI